MMNRSRVVVKNVIWELGYYLVVIILGFLAPRYVIIVYGSEVNGLSSTITQILNIILLLQAGATTAAIYSLYKPIADNDIENICKNVASAEKFFKRIALIFGNIMFVVSVISSFVINSNIRQGYIFFAFFIMGMKSFLDLYATAKFRIIFTAYQEKFQISIATLIEQIIYYLLVFMGIFAGAHFLFIYLWFFVGCVIKIVYLKFIFKKTHADIVTRNFKNESKKIRGHNYSLANEVAHSVIGSSVTILLSFMYGLEETSVYSVYALVSQALALLSTSVYSSFAPSFGNLVAQNKQESVRRILSIFQYLFLMLNTFFMMCMAFLIVPFVKIYTSGIQDVDYVNYSLAVILSLCGIVSAYRIPYNVIVSSCGYFKETWIQPVITAFISIGISIIAGCFNYTFILFGPVTFYAVNFIYQYFKIRQISSYMITEKVFYLFFISLSGLVMAFIISSFITIPAGVIWWIVAAVLFALFSLLFIVALSLLLDKEDYFASLGYIKNFILRRNLHD